jgi:hypothetical protein
VEIVLGVIHLLLAMVPAAHHVLALAASEVFKVVAGVFKV